MKKLTGILILVALIAIIVIQLAGNKKISENRIYQYDKEQPTFVHTEKIQLANAGGNHLFTGTFEANKEVKINADVQGKILRIYVEEGAHVRKGQNLIKLDDQLLRLQLKTINTQIEGLEADVDRYTILSEADAIQGVKLEKTLLGLKTAKIQKETLRATIAKTTIRAPFSGIVTKKMMEVGAFAAPGMPLLIVTEISNLKFTINVAEHEIGLFKMGESYNILADLYPEVELEGKVTLIGSKGNMGNNFPVEFTLTNTPDKKLKSKMFGKVIVNITDDVSSILIPATAIIGSNIQPQVYLVVNGKAKLQNVTVSSRVNGRAVIESGVKEGDVIISAGFINLFDGANVTATKN